MRKKLFVSFLFLVFILPACSGRSTPSQPAGITATASPVASATLAQPTEPTATTTQQPQIEPTNQPTPTELPTEVPLPSPTPTQAPTQESASPTSAESDTVEQAPVSSSDKATEPCKNTAAFYEDVTFPDDTPVRQGEAFTKTWRVRNEGTCAWVGYKLVYAGGEAMNANPSNDIPPAAPGEIINISVDMESPKRGGSHISYWQFATDTGETFGIGAGADGLLWVRVQVDYTSADQTSAPTSSTASTSPTNSTSIAGCASETNPGYVSTILNLVNTARESAGLNALELEDKLSAAAQGHSLDMACNDFISHTGSDGSLWYQRVAVQGYANSNSARENIYVGNPAFGGDAQGAFGWWMNSQIHRDNILKSGVSQIGIAYVYVTGSSYGGYYTLIVARP